MPQQPGHEPANQKSTMRMAAEEAWLTHVNRRRRTIGAKLLSTSPSLDPQKSANKPSSPPKCAKMSKAGTRITPSANKSAVPEATQSPKYRFTAYKSRSTVTTNTTTNAVEHAVNGVTEQEKFKEAPSGEKCAEQSPGQGSPKLEKDEKYWVFVPDADVQART